MHENINDDNFLLFAAKAYDKPNAVLSEFEEDLNRILYIKRLLSKYYASGLMKERLLMNHLIIFYNVFGIEAASRLLFFKLEERDYPVIKPFLLFLNFLPNIIKGINGKDIITTEISLDKGSIQCLRALK
jgi:hypothetical protein